MSLHQVLFGDPKVVVHPSVVVGSSSLGIRVSNGGGHVYLLVYQYPYPKRYCTLSRYLKFTLLNILNIAPFFPITSMSLTWQNSQDLLSYLTTCHLLCGSLARLLSSLLIFPRHWTKPKTLIRYLLISAN